MRSIGEVWAKQGLLLVSNIFLFISSLHWLLLPRQIPRDPRERPAVVCTAVIKVISRTAISLCSLPPRRTVSSSRLGI